ncbi:DUF2057 domain-containing protein [Pseudoalteromonas sp. SSDWG2]|uniref:DUF2057 domain-containing protein n=1 Tax=Pseudoalteromonas sp. SSDWG2 TaxID=3139391 RepID=UPI003BA966C0
MWKKVTSIAALIALGMPSVYAETVSFPAEIIPLQVNDKKVEHSFFNTVDELDLAPGSYRLQLKYSDLYDEGFDDHTVVESEPFWVTLDVAPNRDYDIVFNRAQSIEEAKRYAQQPQVQVKVKGDNASQTSALVSAKPVAEYTPAPKVTPVTLPAKLGATNEASATGSGVNAAAMLEFWWQQATPQEREAFLIKVQK